MTSQPESSPLEVAIVGCGIAGLTAAIALRQHPYINVKIYEKATELKEIGASIALGPNGLRTLERLGLHNAISDEVAFRGPSNLPMIYRHWKTNEVIGVDRHEDVNQYLHRTARYHRAHLHQALLENVPRGIIHLGKQLVSVDVDSRDGVTLKFQDGTVVTADILLGADGLRSGVRSSFVPDFQLKWSGWTAFRAVFPTSLVESIPGLPADSTHWWGLSTNFFASRLGKNTFTVVGGLQSDPSNPNPHIANAEWDQDASLQLFKDTYENWNPVVKALVDATPSPLRFYPNLSCEGPLPTWVFGDRATLIGDAAHAHGGAHATGGSLAIDDAYAFYLSLLTVFPLNAIVKPNREGIGKALRLYEEVRKPHVEKLLNRVLEANAAKVERIRSGKLETDEELGERAARGSNTIWLHEHDVVKAFEATLSRRNEILVQGEAEVYAKL
ncbi:hypothetical protein G7Y89_g2461 [Cudoniella acicularis]|uniref:FAD-binding domain-containing protein n=1 Tax=Cudoniella acicularis TaxID=354080 RepID=A0A8H4RUH0_9HELO|nr:hypothetical protein G7Y89_g2461 [Cudoniella acicularis]